MDIYLDVLNQVMAGTDSAWDRSGVYGGVEALVQVGESGLREYTGRTKRETNERSGEETDYDEVRIFSHSAIEGSLRAIERHTFDWASKALTDIAYGDLLHGIWSEHQDAIHSKLTELNLTGHMQVIDQSLRSDLPEAWRTGALACRTLLQDVAKYLWQDKRRTYDLLPGSHDSGRLAVSANEPLNRLQAYLHQKELTGNLGRFLRGEADRLKSSFHVLNDLQSAAKGTIDRADARSVAIWTYLLLGEIALRTDFTPVVSYVTPKSK